MSRELRGYGTVYKRGSTWWIQFCRNGKSYRESSHSDQRPKAVARLKKRLGESSRGKIIGAIAEKVTLEEMAKNLVADYQLIGNRSIDTIPYLLRPLIGFFRKE